LHVANVGQVAQNNRLVGQQRRRDEGKGGVLVAAGHDLAAESVSTFNDKFIHHLCSVALRL